MRKINKFAKIGGLVLPLLLLMTALSAPVAFADSDCSHCHQEEKDRRSRPKVPRHFGANLSFFKKHLHLRNGELFISASRTAALKKGISNEVFSKFQQVVEDLNESKRKGYITFEKEKGMVMVNPTDKLEEKVNSMLASEGPSLAATSSCGGVTKTRLSIKWWGTQYRVWLNSCDASRMADALSVSGLAEGVIAGLLGGGVPALIIGAFGTYAGYLGWEIGNYNNGTGVVINFAFVGYYGIAGVPSAPVPDVWSQ